ncbi:hypothetical protein KGG70_gp20 [Streptomyces phage Celia]|uniref:Uncharacterized protein n=1 Tax=Streptomyces phage Celia TaxID=2590946 RepID=A0A516KRE1_9CAUD|nr:hypothetical protein KGG70_gp20 [Streptomyces phage Celia]QDP44264.1 hypothetical protein SEA_CELIA_61 [Streptomyces phage Celia]QFG10526.1 helix-turn-helix DNA-binding domain protein [Streptomyces phage Urza]QJD50629.1 hypothetical protein SEA_ITZA_64 [Streptomyces phage Itza]
MAKCETCGQTKPEPKKYSLTPDLVSALTKVYAAGGEALKRSDLDLTNTEYSNFRKLTYWALIENSVLPDGTVSQRLWSITELGIRFIEEGERIPSAVMASGGEYLSNAGDFVDISAALPTAFELGLVAA